MIFRISAFTGASLFAVLSASAAGANEPPLAEKPVAYIAQDEDVPSGMGAVFASKTSLLFLDGSKLALREDSIDMESDDPTAMGDLSAFQRFYVTKSEGDAALPDCQPAPRVLFVRKYDGKPDLVDLEFHSDEHISEIGPAAQPCAEYRFVAAVPRGSADRPGSTPDAVSNAQSDAAETVRDAPVATASPEPTKWMKNLSVNPMDDTKTVTLRLAADEGVSQFKGPVAMIARCKSDRTELYVDWKDYLGDDSSSVYEDWKYVEIRMGSKPMRRERWTLSTDSQATFSKDWAGAMLKEMLEVDKVVMRVTPYNESPVTAVFDVRGLRGPLQELADTCNWKF